jgi:hypothetical protein
MKIISKHVRARQFLFEKRALTLCEGEQTPPAQAIKDI